MSSEGSSLTSLNTTGNPSSVVSPIMPLSFESLIADRSRSTSHIKRGDSSGRDARAPRLLLHVFLNALGTDLGAVDIALRVGDDAFRGAGDHLVGIRFGIGDEG